MTPSPSPRRAKLEEFVAAHPNDAFARYGLAMDCANSGDDVAAESHFRELLNGHADYVYGYFQLGNLLARTERVPEAREVLAKGIAAAQKAGDAHAHSELQNALDMLGAAS